MRFLLTTTGGDTPDEAMMAEVGRFVEELTKAGVLLATGGLDPAGTHIKSSGGSSPSPTARSPRRRRRSSASR